MSIKKKLGLGIASAALGISLVGGGTFAYFNDVETYDNTFAAGTLDLDLNPEVIFNVSNLKPGDYMIRQFDMENNGSLDIAKVLLKTSYTVTDAKNNNGNNDFGDHIYVDFLVNKGDKKDHTVLEGLSLKTLKGMTEDDLAKTFESEWKKIWGPVGYWEHTLVDGIEAGGKDNMKVKIYFKDNKQDQNIFQGDSLKLEWKFTAKQTDGEHVAND